MYYKQNNVMFLLPVHGLATWKAVKCFTRGTSLEHVNITKIYQPLMKISAPSGNQTWTLFKKLINTPVYHVVI